MPKPRERIVLAWSGGKDSVMALHELRKAKDYEVVGLLTCVTEGDGKVTLHGAGRELLEAQARALDLPLETATVPKGCCHKTHAKCLSEMIARHFDAGIRKVAFGDLYLDDMRDFREETLDALGMEAIFPLWQRDTKELSYSFIQLKYKALVTCVDEQTLDQRYVGRPYDRKFLSDLPLTVDPCGENGEFHTFVFDGPSFKDAVACKLGGKFTDEHFHYAEISARAEAPAKRRVARSS